MNTIRYLAAAYIGVPILGTICQFGLSMVVNRMATYLMNSSEVARVQGGLNAELLMVRAGSTVFNIRKIILKALCMVVAEDLIFRVALLWLYPDIYVAAVIFGLAHLSGYKAVGWKMVTLQSICAGTLGVYDGTVYMRYGFISVVLSHALSNLLSIGILYANLTSK